MVLATANKHWSLLIEKDYLWFGTEIAITEIAIKLINNFR